MSKLQINNCIHCGFKNGIIEGLFAENERLNDKDGLYDEVKELQVVNDSYQGEIFKLEAEIRQLKADAKHDADVCYDVDDKNHEWIEELKADNKRLHLENVRLDNDNRKRLNEIIELQSDNKRLVNQVSSNRGSNSTSHTIQREIAEYMSMNDKCKDARLFILPIEEFDKENDWHGWLHWHDGMSS